MGVTYAILTGDKTVAGSISSYVAYDNIDRDSILEDAQALIFETLRAREMRSVATLAMGVGEYTKALPTGFLNPIGGKIRDTKSRYYQHTTIDRLLTRRIFDENGVIVSTSIPLFWAVADELIQFEQAFNEARSLFFAYYKSPALLSSGNQTNFLTTRYPNILRKACRVEAFGQMEYWESRAQELDLLAKLIQRANIEADMSLDGADFDASQDSDYGDVY